jgi:hypothetical protein
MDNLGVRMSLGKSSTRLIPLQAPKAFKEAKTESRVESRLRGVSRLTAATLTVSSGLEQQREQRVSLLPFGKAVLNADFFTLQSSGPVPASHSTARTQRETCWKLSLVCMRSVEESVLWAFWPLPCNPSGVSFTKASVWAVLDWLDVISRQGFCMIVVYTFFSSFVLIELGCLFAGSPSES